MAKNKLFKTIPSTGGSKIADEIDMKLIEENLFSDKEGYSFF